MFLAATTLNLETMYGQTNAWMFPCSKYGAFEINGIDVFVVSERTDLSLPYQQMSKGWILLLLKQNCPVLEKLLGEKLQILSS